MKNILFAVIAIIASIFWGCKKKEVSPNIIFLLTDDQRWDAMGCAGNSYIETPSMDKLAEGGIMFKKAYVTTPICAISRASILSGQYAYRHGIEDFATSFTDSAYQYTYPMLLKKAGYKIGFIGKYGVGKAEDFPVKEYDYWRCFPGQGYYWHKDSLDRDVHLTKIIGNQALEFLESYADKGPFCLSVSFKAPHSQDGDIHQFLYDSAYINLYNKQLFPMSTTADSVYWQTFPEAFKRNNEGRIRWKIRFETPEKYQTSIAGYYRLIYGVDVQIANIRKYLKKHNLDKNTIIILMGDNGYYLGEHGLAGKWYGHEESLRVPLIIYDPAMPDKERGNKCSDYVLNIDIAPTILDYAGVDIPVSMQGKSIRKLIYGLPTNRRKEFMIEHRFKYKTIPRSEGVVSNEWRYVHFLDRDTSYEWLFNINNDPYEINNLAKDIEFQPTKNKLKEQLLEMKQVYK